MQLQFILRGIIPGKYTFYTLFGKKTFSSEYHEYVSYTLEQSYMSSVVGTAFDYMARFMISRNLWNGSEHVIADTVAEIGLARLERFCDKRRLRPWKRNLRVA